ncbi:MAG: glycosyltransferase family 9 protein [Gemmatimonadota bacterium]|nr:glycosyltransferase family 9 protein [Gemmatimonadota bacterium]
MRTLVVQTSFIGDVVLTTPLITRLAHDSEVHVVTTPAGASLLESHPSVARVLVYDKRGTDGGISGLLRVARAARGSRTAYLCQGSTRSGALAFAAGCSERIGFSTSDGRWTYTARVSYHDDWHHARRLLSLADLPFAVSASDPSSSAIRPTLFPTANDVAAVDEITRGRHRPMLALAPGSVWGTKRWPGFGPLAAILADQYDIAIIGGRDDAGPSGEIRLRVERDRIIDATGKLSLLGSAELIRRCAVLVSNDSAPQHLASAMGTPTVTVFGPTVPEFGFGPLAPASKTVGNRSLACRPCDRHGPEKCPLGHWRCMNEITPDEVAAAVRSVISKEAVR